MTEPNPTVKLTEPTPQREPEDYFDQTQSKKDSSAMVGDEEPVTQEPKRTEDMLLATPDKTERSNPDNNDDCSDVTSVTMSEQGSGYERESNECTECCIDLIGCFGLFDTCCPSTGEGFITNLGVFCGNILVGCCKC
mmetsp:Transcript_3138/g.3062  ORF Transcript_3138/g.3062 Transcript_3138/m.3062 type:complete len:137 (+) Transcript_3138:218-628(+)